MAVPQHPALHLLPPEQVRAARRVVLIVVDGLGDDYLLAHGRDTAFAAHRVGRINSVFPSTTATAITTFLTGHSPREHGLLRALIVRSGEPMSRQQLLDRVFSDEDDVQPAALDTLMHRLRRRLEGGGVQIVTYRGLGYALESAATGHA
jgi:predicted AlkP superfamily pyrophosphatase or phosphodiesterase